MSKPTQRGDSAGWARAGLPTGSDAPVSRETSRPEPLGEQTDPIDDNPGTDLGSIQDRAVQEAVREALAHPLRSPARPDEPVRPAVGGHPAEPTEQTEQTGPTEQTEQTGPTEQVAPPEAPVPAASGSGPIAATAAPLAEVDAAPAQPVPVPSSGVPLQYDTPIGRAAETAVRVLSGRIGEALPRPQRTRVFTVANQKGGVGKTTTTVNVAAALALHGLRVLVVDLDPQGNASTALGVPHHAEIPSVYDVLVEGRALAEVVQPAEGVANLFCAPATIDLAGAEIELVSLVARESRLQRAIEAYSAGLDEPLDYVFIDCPPSLGLLTVNAFVAAEEVLIPIQCEYYALEGLGQLLKNVEMVKAHLNPRLDVTTIMLTMYDGRTRLAAQVAEEVREHFGAIVLRTAIPRSVRISEAPSYQQTVITYDPGSTGALCYLEAAREIALAAVPTTRTTPLEGS